MADFLSNMYLWNKSFHLIFVIAWMAGLFYLPRLFAYHTQYSTHSRAYKTFLTMERRLLKIIMTPAMIFSIIFGLLLLFTPGIYSPTFLWIHIKILFVFFMILMHVLMARWYIEFKNYTSRRTNRFFRTINEIPPLCMIAIVLLVIFKPF